MNGTRTGLAFVAGLAALAAAYLVVQAGGLGLLPGDEGIYAYDSLLVTRGALPYRDFFLAHPPLRVLLGAIPLGLGLPVDFAKWIEPVATVGAAACAGAAVVPIAGVAGALLASFLYLFSSLALSTGVTGIGANLAAALVALSFLLASRRRFLASGLVLAVASTQALFALVPGPALLAWAFRERRVRGFLAGCLAALPLHGVLAGIFGFAYLEQVLLFQATKAVAGGGAYPVDVLARFGVGDAGLLAFGLAGFVSKDRVGRWAAIAGFQSVLVTALYPSLMRYYFTVSLPFLAIAAAIGLGHLGRRLSERSPRLPASILVAAAVLLAYLPHAFEALDQFDRRREQAREIAALQDRVRQVRPASGLLFGDGAVVPLLALRTGLEVAGRQVDTNWKRFLTGIADPEQMLAAAFAGPLPAVILLDNGGCALVPAIRQRVERDLRPAIRFRLPASGFTGVLFLPPGEIPAGGPAPDAPADGA